MKKLLESFEHDIVVTYYWKPIENDEGDLIEYDKESHTCLHKVWVSNVKIHDFEHEDKLITLRMSASTIMDIAKQIQELTDQEEIIEID